MAPPSQQSENEKTAELHMWELTRPAGHIQTMFNLYSELGMQSNLVSAATYHNNSGESTLQPGLLLPALRKLVEEHYALSVISVEQPSKSSKTKQRLWEARLERINIPSLVEYLEVKDAETTNGMHRLIEETHNEWLDPADKSTPMWRVKVVNGCHLLFIYNHFIGDGMSGYSFHRNLLQALNSHTNSANGQDESTTIPKLDPPPHWHQEFPIKASLLKLISSTLILKFMQLFGTWLMFCDAKINQRPYTYADRFDKNLRCRTAVYGLDLTMEEQTALVRACKNRGLTYNALLHTLTISTLAADIYPDKRMGRSSTPINFRRYAKVPQTLDVLVNSVGTMTQNFWSLTKFRSAVKASTSLSAPVNAQNLPPVDVNVDAVSWIAKKYAQDMQAGLASYELFQASLGWDWIGKDIQDIFYSGFPNLRLYQRNVVLLSNLGPFDAGSDKPDSEAAWTITDIHFSAAATSSTYGTTAPVFNIASLKGGACHMSVIMEEGLLPDAMVKTFLTRLKQRLLLFAKLADVDI